MKVALLFAIIVTLGVASACGGDSVPNNEVGGEQIEVPEHMIAAVDDTSFGITRRLSYRIRLPERSSEDEARIIAKSIVDAKHRNGDLVNALYFYYYFPSSDPFSYADGAIVWAPNGDWSRASSVQRGDYASFKFSTEFYGR